MTLHDLATAQRTVPTPIPCPNCGGTRTKPWGRGWLPGSGRWACADCPTQWLVPTPAPMENA